MVPAIPGGLGVIETHIVNDVRGFESLGPAWRELTAESGSDNLFLTWEWLFTWWRHLRGRRALSLITARLNGTLVGLAPLALAAPSWSRLRPVRMFEFLGTGTVGSDYLDVITRRGHEHAVLAVLARHLQKRGRVITLTQLDPNLAVAWPLADHLGRRGWKVSVARTSTCPRIDLRGLSWPDYLQQRSPLVRYNFRRRLRQLERLGPVTLEAAETDSARREDLERLVSWHLRRWSARGGSDAFQTREVFAFHEDFSRLALERGWLRLLTLRVASQPVAALYCFEYNGELLFYQSGFDERFARFSVGLVAMGLAIKRAIESGARVYDMLHGDEPYKFQWTTSAREIGRLELYPPHLLGSWCRRTTELARAARRTSRSLLAVGTPASGAEGDEPTL